jgi:hypothetical protein
MTETVVRYPTRDHVKHALWQLDGKEVNDLYLRTSGSETYLGICGGPERYMVTLTEHAERFAQLLDPEEPSQVRAEIMCGGQLTSFPPPLPSRSADQP